MNKIFYDSIMVVQIKTTCWENENSLKNKDVIELGCCLFKPKTLLTSDPFNILVNTGKEISPYCVQKTGLTPEDIASGVSFCDVMDAIVDMFDSREKCWASYGSFAEQVIKRQCREMNVAYPFSDRFLNIKSLFPIVFNQKEEISLKESMRKLKLPIADAQDCQDEAMNAAIVLGEILRGGPLPK